MCILPACMSVYHIYVVPMKSTSEPLELQSPGIGITDVRELPGKCWGLNLGHLEDPPVLLTTEPSFQPHSRYFYMNEADFALH